MSDVNLATKSDLANLFQELEDAAKYAKKENKENKVKTESQVKELDSFLTSVQEVVKVIDETPKIPKKEIKIEEPKLIEIADIVVEEPIIETKSLSVEDEDKLGAFAGLMSSFGAILDSPPEVNDEDALKLQVEDIYPQVITKEQENNKLEALQNLFSTLVDHDLDVIKPEVVEEKEIVEIPPLVIEKSSLVEIAKDTPVDITKALTEVKQRTLPTKEQTVEATQELITNVIANLDDMESKTEVKEQLSEIGTIRQEFDNFRSLVSQQIASSKMSGAGGGEVRLEFLDDVNRDSVKVDGRFLQYNSTSKKIEGGNFQSISTSIIPSADDTYDLGSASKQWRNLYLGGSTLVVDGASLAASELAAIDGITAGTVAASKAVIVDSNKDITGFRNVTVGGNLTVQGTTTTIDSATINVVSSFVFEGATANDYETTLTVTDPTADRTITIPDATGTLAILDLAQTLSNKTLTAPTITGTAVMADLDISGDVDVDGTLETDALTIGGTAIGSIYGAIAGSSSIVTTGALDSGSITSGFGTIDTGSSTITSTGAITGGSLVADDVTINGKVVTMTGSTDDTAVLTVATNGALTLETTDTAAAAANIQITADGTVDIDSAGVLTLDSGAAINIEPASGSAILLDGTISIDAGVVTGATSITSTAFVGDITGDVTGNTSGTAATVTTAAQTNITSLGTLTTLTVDNVVINGTTIGHTDDTDLMTVADGLLTVDGEVSMTTLDIGGTNVTATATELNYVDGVTSAIQTQMDTKTTAAAALAAATAQAIALG
jgi:hypothetical protein